MTEHTCYLKITNAEENHHGLQYTDGLVADPNPFKRTGSCVPNGIYFSDNTSILKFLNYGNFIRVVTIPVDADMVQDPDGTFLKWRASKVVLGPRRDLREVSTWEWMKSIAVVFDTYHTFPLRWAVQEGLIEVVKYLLRIGVPDPGNCALEEAISRRSLDIFKLIVGAGVDIHMYEGWCLRYAAGLGCLSIVQYLVELGAMVTVSKDSALIGASRHGHLAVVKYLVDHGADAKALNGGAKRIALMNGHTEVVKYLESLS